MKIFITEYEQALLASLTQGGEYKVSIRKALFHAIRAATLVGRDILAQDVADWFIHNVEKTDYDRFLPLERIAENLPLAGSLSQKKSETVEYMKIIFDAERKVCREGMHEGKTGYKNFRLVGDTKNVYDRLGGFLQQNIKVSVYSFLSYEQILQSIPDEIKQNLKDDEAKVKKFILATVEENFHVRRRKTRDKRYTDKETMGFFGLEMKHVRN